MKIMMLKVKSPSKGLIFARVLLVILLIANMAFVWCNSAKVSTDSNRDSLKISRKITPKIVKGYKEMPRQEKRMATRKVNGVIREMAHAAEYVPFGILFLLLIVCVFDFGKSSKWHVFVFSLAVTALGCFVLALSDEIHQLFVEGRAFQLFDIGMDMLGSMSGFAVTYLVVALVHRHRVGS